MTKSTTLTFYSRTHVGKVRTVNEDSLAFCTERNFAVVADGIGGQEHGKIASTMAVEACVEHLNQFSQSHLSQDGKALPNAIKFANDQVTTLQNDKPDLSKMGSTLSCIQVDGKQLQYAWIGDSRVYRINPRLGRIDLLSKDHTLDPNKIDPREAPILHKRASSILTKSIGGSSNIKPDAGTVALEDSDIILCCTDGLSDLVPDELLLEYAQQFDGAPNSYADKLIDRALDCGGKDNISFVFVQTDV